VNPTGYVQVVAELNGSNQLARGYLWGLQPAAMRTFVPGTFTATNAYFGFDGHGSVRYLTDDLGHTTDTYDFDAFGNLLSSTGTTQNNYLFAGEQFDPALGIYYNRARYYDQRQGRFWTMDTYEGDPESPESLHKYLYADASPIDNSDPTGKIITLLDRALAGIQVHNRLGVDFVARTPGGFTNRAISTVIRRLFGLNTSVLLRPDLVSPLTREVYEIKSSPQEAAGVTQLMSYIVQLNLSTPEDDFGFWHLGTTYNPPDKLSNVFMGLNANVNKPANGVISYELDDSGGGGGIYNLLMIATLATLATIAILSLSSRVLLPVPV
jgi:RHS repeat-associated protein